MSECLEEKLLRAASSVQSSKDSKASNGGKCKVGEPLLLVGFPLGFYDTVHHLPVVRQVVVASAFGVRFEGQGFFFTASPAS